MVTGWTVGDDDAAALATGDTGTDGALETGAAERDSAGDAEPATGPHATDVAAATTRSVRSERVRAQAATDEEYGTRQGRVQRTPAGGTRYASTGSPASRGATDDAADASAADPGGTRFT
jgi:hypothetical protein